MYENFTKTFLIVGKYFLNMCQSGWKVSIKLFDYKPFRYYKLIKLIKTLCPKSPSAQGLVACLPVRLLFKSPKHNALYPA